jgi:hypothetical protein
MGTQEHEARSLDELDAADREEVERVENFVLEVVDQEHPATVSELSMRVRARAGDVDNSVIRAAILRLLNENRLRVGHGQHVASAP